MKYYVSKTQNEGTWKNTQKTFYFLDSRDVKNPKDRALLIQNNLFISDGSFVSLLSYLTFLPIYVPQDSITSASFLHFLPLLNRLKYQKQLTEDEGFTW